jgi:RNA polymerase sigma-54 factor
MNINFNLSGNVAQQQQLNLAPQLLQWLRLLQVPAQHLEQLVRSEVETNPALEIDDSLPATSDDDDSYAAETDDLRDADCEREGRELEERFEVLAEIDSQWAEENRNMAGEDIGRTQDRIDYQMQSLTSASSLQEHLLSQLTIMDKPDAIKANATLIIGMLDSRGYLDVSLDELAEELGIAVEGLEDALAAVQECEPVGVGARDLRECLLLQLSPTDDSHAVARRIVSRYLEALARGQLEGIARQLSVPLAEVESAVKLIRALNPTPGKTFEEQKMVTQTVTPDVVIRRNAEGGFDIELVEQSLPRLRISPYCRRMIEQGDLSKTDLAYIRSRIRAASFLIDGLEKRGSTLRRIAEEIIRYQHRFLRGEESEIRPLTMAKVASFIGVHDTTVSRALSEKYIATPVGVLPMKEFFCMGYRCDDGSAMTPEMVRQRIKQMILDEAPEAPIKDETIAAQLRESGVPVARRTVAKYRGELGVPSSKERALANRKGGLRVIRGGGKPGTHSESEAVAFG